MLSLDDFKPMELEDKPLFDKHYAKYPPTHSDNLFSTMMSWKDYGNYKYTFFENNLIISSKIKNQLRFRPPSGEFKKNIFDQVLNLAKKQETEYPFGVITLKTKNWILDNYPGFKLTPHRDYFEYVYSASDLAELSGSDYSKIRNRLNKFRKNFEYSLEEISKDNFDEVKTFLKRWCIWKDCESDELLQAEKKAVLFSISNFFEMGLSGILIRIKGKIEALAVYEAMNNDTVVIHYEKGSPYYDGIYKAINQETADKIKKDFKFINRESDMGIPGLRKAKMSYRPHHMIEVFHMKKEDILI